ncbi:MAG TPA: SRPBCC family protein [Gracilimonas sp.]|uniref:SRPBCC family protein n=1 Tax=Gracilimonas sp. TaxID=1974203 RepID=UPI002D9253CE|nr:SRPBCC family protein [Gracilimonas sp.]
MKHKTKSTEVRVEMMVKASVEKTFRTFTKRCHDWWPKEYKLAKAERRDIVMESHVGGRWYETATDGSECLWGEILVWDPPHYLAFSWQIKPDFTPEPHPEKSSRVEIRFRENGPESTIITLVHSDFERHGEGWEDMRDSVANEGGWQEILTQFSNIAALKKTLLK